MGMLRSKATFANVTSLVALFVALGGTAYAVTQLDGSKIVNRSIPAGKLKKNTLTGTEIKESKLGTVKSAEVSDRTLQLTVSEPKGKSKGAARELSAGGDSGASLVKLSIGQTENLLTSGPFSLKASCVDQGGAPGVRAVATTTEAGTYVVGAGHAAPFGPGEEVPLVDVDGPPFPAGTLSGSGIGTTFVAPSGATLQLGGVGVLHGTQVLGADCVASAYGVG
jgi:hypothetical protein